MPRVALLTNVMAHYRVPCFRRLSELLGGQVTFFFLARKMSHRMYVMAGRWGGFDAVTLPGLRWRRGEHDDCHLNDIRPVVGGRYSALILGAWDEPTYLVLWAWAVARGKRLLFWTESTAHELPRARQKELLKRMLLGKATGCIVPGRRAWEYCRRLGVAEERIFVAPNATDRDYFRSRADRLLPERQRLRQEAGVRRFAVLFVGRLVEALKGVSILIQALGKMEREGFPVTLLVAGDGPDRARYEALAVREGLEDVRFLGILDHEALCPCYAMADVLVLPSRSEPWGFVLNEGMEFGLPLVVSEAVGAGPDLVRPGVNGFVVPVGDVRALAEDLTRLARDEELRSRMGEASREIVQDFTAERWARGMVQAIEFAAGLGS